jgi:hypothetical protein
MTLGKRILIYTIGSVALFLAFMMAAGQKYHDAAIRMQREADYNSALAKQIATEAQLRTALEALEVTKEVSFRSFRSCMQRVSDPSLCRNAADANAAQKLLSMWYDCESKRTR